VVNKNLQDENDGFLAARDQLDDAYRKMLAFKGKALRNKATYINFNGLMARAMGQRGMNNVVKLDNGYLADLYGKEDVRMAAARMTQLCRAQERTGKYFLFVMTPRKVPKYEDILPAGYIDYSNQNADDMLEMLRSVNVPVLDLRDEIRRDGLSYADVFFKTDHHWRPEAGFWAFTKLVDYLSESGIAVPVDPLYTDIEHYDVKVYPDWFLGSLGKRTGIYYAGVDDISVITPKFETNLSLEIPQKGISKSGSFAEVGYRSGMVAKNHFTSNPYALYGHSDSSGKAYRNENAPLDLKILTIRDSYACVATTFLPLVATQCDELDMRYFGGGSFREYYEAFDPDVLIVFVNAGSGPACKNTTYDFFGD